MANRCIKNYFMLEEAICDIISQDNENDVTCVVIMLPPDLNVLIDEEELGDDELYGNKLPRDVPGNIEVVTYRPTVEDVWSRDYDKPLRMIASFTSLIVLSPQVGENVFPFIRFTHLPQIKNILKTSMLLFWKS